jgi:hypothetical protein
MEVAEICSILWFPKKLAEGREDGVFQGVTSAKVFLSTSGPSPSLERGGQTYFSLLQEKGAPIMADKVIDLSYVKDITARSENLRGYL